MLSPSHCLVHLFLKYSALCPSEHPNGTLYLTPLKNPMQDSWYSCVPIGQNKLVEKILHLMRDAGIPGYFTNYSLRTTAT